MGAQPSKEGARAGAAANAETQAAQTAQQNTSNNRQIPGVRPNSTPIRASTTAPTNTTMDATSPKELRRSKRHKATSKATSIPKSTPPGKPIKGRPTAATGTTGQIAPSTPKRNRTPEEPQDAEEVVQSIEPMSLDSDMDDVCHPVFVDEGAPELQRRQAQLNYLESTARGTARPMTDEEVGADYASYYSPLIEKKYNGGQTKFDSAWELPKEKADEGYYKEDDHIDEEGDEEDAARMWFTHQPFQPIPYTLAQAPAHIRNYIPKNPDFLDLLRDKKQHPEDPLSKPNSAKSGYTYLDKNDCIKHGFPLSSPKKLELEDRPHPNLQRLERIGSANERSARYYKVMPNDVSIPFAGKGRNYDGGALGDDDEDLGRQTQMFDLFRESNLQRMEKLGGVELMMKPQESDHIARPKVRIDLPDHIKSLLVDDWQNVTKEQKLVPLPAKRTVEQILDEYFEAEKTKRAPGSPEMNILEETVAGLKDYFERALGRILLYKFERQQYHEVRMAWESGNPKPEVAGKSACETYGVEHLCRLLSNLPELVAQTNMDSQSVNRLREELNTFTAYVGKKENLTRYFAESYETPHQTYVEKASRG